MAKDEKINRTAFILYSKFFEISMRKNDKTYYDFITSKYFDGFMKFGKYVIDIQAIRPDEFMKFLIKASVKFDDWTRDFIYDQYVRELNKKETPDAAVERTILLFQQWEQDSGKPWNDFFREIHPNQAVGYIKSGRISPWVLYSAPSAIALLERMSDEQVSIVEKSVDPRFWSYKFEQEEKYVSFIRSLLTEYGL